MLYSRRKRLQRFAELEMTGVNLWSRMVDDRARSKILYALEDYGGRFPDYCASAARAAILRSEGLPFLSSARREPAHDLRDFVLTCDDEMMPTVLEALFEALEKERDTDHRRFSATVNVVLREHRVSYELVEGQMVEFESREMHMSVTAPALTLLVGRPDLDNAEEAYRKALHEIAGGDAGDAITDAATALQDTLTALGCDGNALGALITSAKKRGVLAAHDVKLAHWVSADRSEKGDAHSASDATIDDAWLIVHVVGALILRLAQGSPRGESGGGR